MTTQYTTILKLALPVQGELSGTWGDIVNNNITQMVEQAVAGKATVNSWTGNAHTLTTADGTTAESRCAILELTDTGTALSGAGTVTCPTNTKLYIVDNNTAQIITVKTSGGTGVAVPVGKTMLVYCDGTNVVEGVTHANSLSLGTSTSTVNAIATATDLGAGGSSNSNLPTQLAVKTYVDSQVGTVDTLAEILANGNVTGANDIDVENAQKVQFRDSAIYINSSADGQLDLVADTEIQIAATTVDLNGNLDVSGTALVTGVLTTTAATVFNGGFASNADSTLGTDKKVQFRDAAIYINSSADGQLDIVADGEVQIATALVDINGNLDVSGTTNISGSTTFTKNAIASVAISGVARSSNTVTVTTSAVHGLSVNDLVNLNGVTDTSFNGYFTVTAVSSTTVFTFSQTAANASSSGGSTTEIVYNLNASGTALNQMNGPLNITANSPIDGLEITQSGAGNGLHVTGTTDLVGNTTLTGNLDISGTATGATSFATAAGGTFTTAAGNDLNIVYPDSRSLFIKEGSTTHVTVDNAGNVGIGISPQSFTDLMVNTATDRNIGIFDNAAGATICGLTDAGASADLRLAGSPLIFTGNGGSGAEAMRIDASGNVGIGTTPSSGVRLDVRSNAAATLGDFRNASATGFGLYVAAGDTSSQYAFRAADYENNALFSVMGDGNVGIGTTNPAQRFVVAEGTNQHGIELAPGTISYIQAYDRATSDYGNLKIDAETIQFGTDNGTTRMLITSAGSIQIPNQNAINELEFTGTEYTNIYSATTSGMDVGTTGSGYLRLLTNNTEAARFDSSQNLLVGVTTTTVPGVGNTTAGVSIRGTDGSFFSRALGSGDTNNVVSINRSTEDGNILGFQKDGTTVGSIGSRGEVVSHIILDPRSGGAGLTAAGASLFPTNNAGAVSDGAIDLGYSVSGTNYRFKDLWLSGGVRGTSTLDITIPETAGGAIQLEFGNNTNNARRTVRAYKDHFEPVDADDGVISLGQAANRWKDLYLSGGAYLGGTAAANKLDDYEEGTFTPTIIGSGTNPTVTYGTRIGKYTKVGNLVSVYVSISTSDFSGGSGNLIIDALPFTASQDCGGGAPMFYKVNSFAETAPFINSGTAYVLFLGRDNTDTSTAWSIIQTSAWTAANPTLVQFQMTYFAS